MRKDNNRGDGRQNVNVQRTLEGEFDYVIVGAGTAGCVLANRLTADLGVAPAIAPNYLHPTRTVMSPRTRCA